MHSRVSLRTCLGEPAIGEEEQVQPVEYYVEDQSSRGQKLPLKPAFGHGLAKGMQPVHKRERMWGAGIVLEARLKYPALYVCPQRSSPFFKDRPHRGCLLGKSNTPIGRRWL
jgi:hypothetical protein